MRLPIDEGKISVGAVVKSQGIRGEMKLSCYLDSPEMLVGVQKLYLGDNAHRVKAVRVYRGAPFVLFADVTDRNAADLFRGTEVFADKADLRLPEGRFFLQDLLTCSVYFDDGGYVGKVTDIAQYGSADVYTVEKDGREISFPFLKDLVLSVDTEGRKIVVKKRRFEEVSVMQDEN